MLTWIITTVDCNSEFRLKRSLLNDGWKPVGTVIDLKNAEVVKKDGPLHITHMPLENDKRARRGSNFDRGYEEFLRNYHSDNGIDRRGRYRVKESEESGSAESSSYSNEDDDGESGSNEDNRQRYTKKNAKAKNGKQNAPKKKSTKKCTTERRGNMVCSICYDSKNDGKAESCSYNSDPKDTSYEYSEDTVYSNRGGENESLEERDNDDENDSDEAETKKKKPTPQPINKRPPNRRPTPPRFFPPFLGRPPPSKQNYGPQTFLPQNFQPISVSNGRRPIRIQIKNAPDLTLPSPVSLFRYRALESPFGSQHIRLITYPNGPPPFVNNPSQNQNRSPQPYTSSRRPVTAAQEQRPPRDINGAHSESLLSNVTKQHLFELIPKIAIQGTNHGVAHGASHGAGHGTGHGTAHSPNREYAAFMNQDWSRCKKSTENDQVCFECYVDGERRKECMYAAVNKQPDKFYKSYTKSKQFSSNHPYSFDLPEASVSKHTKHSEQKSKSHSTRHKDKDNKSKNHHDSTEFDTDSGSDERFTIDLKSENYENQPNTTNGSNVKLNNDTKQEQPQSQPILSSAADVIYGKRGTKPVPEPVALGLFFQTDPGLFNQSVNGHKNDDAQSNIETTTANIHSKPSRNKIKTKSTPNSRANVIRAKTTKAPTAA